MVAMIHTQEVNRLKATIEGEDDDYVKIYVADNFGSEHELTIEKKTGDIPYHQCESYADNPRDRTPDENEYNEQARRYAKYYVYRERGYDTLENAENPDYINAVREAINELSASEFERYFRPLYQQIQSHHDSSVDRLVEHPPGVRREDAVVYELDVYLGVDLEDGPVSDVAGALAKLSGLDLEEATAQPVTDVSEQELSAWEAVGQQVIEVTDPADVSLEISAVSGIHIGFPNADGEHEVHRAEDPLERESDATIELIPADPGPFEEFREYLDHHLRCQIRDCFAGMGLLPPEPFRTIGFGKFIYARRYDHYDLYPPLHTGVDSSGGLFG